MIDAIGHGQSLCWSDLGSTDTIGLTDFAEIRSNGFPADGNNCASQSDPDNQEMGFQHEPPHGCHQQHYSISGN